MSESWTVKRVIVTPRGVADSKEQYLMQFKSGQAPFLIMDDANLPVAINTEELNLPEPPELPEPVEAQPTPLETRAAKGGDKRGDASEPVERKASRACRSAYI